MRLGNDAAARQLAARLAARAAAFTLATGVARAAFAGALWARPGLLGRLLGLDSGTATRGDFLGRMIAGREAALGVGTLLAVHAGRGRRGWLLAQLISDAGDAVAVGRAAGQGRVNRLPASLLVLFAVAGVAGEAASIAGLTGWD